MLKCYICGREFKDFSGMNRHFTFKHKDELDKITWSGAKAKISGTRETVKSEPITSEMPEQLQDSDPSKQEIEAVKSTEELTGNESTRPENVELLWDEDKPFEMRTARTMPKSMKMDPRIDILYSALKNRGIIPESWKISDFVNNYVLGHVAMKDNLNLSVTQDIQRRDGKEKVVLMENEFTNPKKSKTTDEEMEDLERVKIRQMKRKQFEEEFGKDVMAKVDDKTFDNMFKMLDKITSQRMAMKLADQMFGGEEGGKSKEVQVLQEQVKKMEDERKMGDLKGAIESLKERIESIKSQRPSGEIGAKDIFQMYLVDRKKTDELKDVVRSKDTEILKQGMDNQNKMLVDKLGDLKNRPDISAQVGELQNTAEALKKVGLMGKVEEKSGAQITKELIQGVTDTIVNNPGTQKWIESGGIDKAVRGVVGSPGQQQYTPEQMAQIQALQKQQQQAQPPQQPQKEAPAVQTTVTEEEQKMYDNLVNISDAEDKRKREAKSK